MCIRDSLITGEDFAQDDPIRGRGAIYGWIQGRGLESLVGHARFLAPDAQYAPLVTALDEMIGQITVQLQIMRSRNGGHLSFLMDPDGQPFSLDLNGCPVPFAIDAESPYGFSDLFASKGLFAAATHTGNDAALREALDYVERVEKAIWDERFQSDQIPLDPKLRPEPRDGFRAHGAYMIQLSLIHI